MIFFDKVAILGTGLLGASFAFALKEKKLAGKISAWSRSPSTREKCKARGDIFDAVCETPWEAVKDADLVLICTPTSTIARLLAQVSKSLKKGALVSDVGSVKGSVCRDCSKIMENTGASFIGSHPMAGSEKIGIDYADLSLFTGRPCFVVAEKNENKLGQKVLGELWKNLGMKVFFANPDMHDSIVAHVSHLPHLLAVVLCAQSSEFSGGDLRDYSGPGFADTTRVASGSPEMWDSICADNKIQILSALKDFSADLQKLISALENSDTEYVGQILRKAKNYRDALGNAK